MDTWGKVIVLAHMRGKRAASASLRPNVYEIRTGAGSPPVCSIHPFAAPISPAPLKTA